MQRLEFDSLDLEGLALGLDQAAGAESALPHGLAGLLPPDPADQLRLAHRLALHAYNQRVKAAEAEAAQLRASLAQRAGQVAALEGRLTAAQLELQAAQDRAAASAAEAGRLGAEKAALIATVKRLNRELAKLEGFRRSLLQTLQTDPAEGRLDDPDAAADQASERLVQSVLSRAAAGATPYSAGVPPGPQYPEHMSSHSAGTYGPPPPNAGGHPAAAAQLPYDSHGRGDGYGAAASHPVSNGYAEASSHLAGNGYAPSGSYSNGPPASHAHPHQPGPGSGGYGGASPARGPADYRHVLGAEMRGLADAAGEGRPSSRHSSAHSQGSRHSTSPTRSPGGRRRGDASNGGGGGGAPGGSSPGRLDGKEFFRQARLRLPHAAFSEFLAAIKELNSGRQGRDDVLRRARALFGAANGDLYAAFEGLLSRHLPPM